MVKVIDAIMGSGKSSAAIQFMNEHPDRRYIYITPYKSEADRICRACPDLDFHKPRVDSAHKGSKVLYTVGMIEAGMNIATTHQAFERYSRDMIHRIQEQGYTIIIDESVQVFRQDESVSASDIRMMLNSGCLTEITPGQFAMSDPEFEYKKDGHFYTFLEQTKKKPIMIADGSPAYWILDEEIFKLDLDIYILTYLFEEQDMCYMFKMHGIPYEYMWVRMYPDGTYRFEENPDLRYVPEYTHHMYDLIDVVDHKINKIGEPMHALSCSWFEKADANNIKTLRNNLYNYFKHICVSNVDERIWSTFKDAQKQITGKGYTKSFAPFNLRAENTYANKTALAYCVNIFVPTPKKIFFGQNGINVDDDAYALSTMIQWIWRSAIRTGRPITLYVPSRRMRNILTDWMDTLTYADPIGGDVNG